MCLALLRRKGRSHLPDAYIDAAFTRHPDGYGLAYAERGALHVERFAPKDRAGFRAALKRVDATGLPFAAHFRFATSGPVDAAHAHPYVYTDPAGFEVAVLHNGGIDIAHNHRVESDTSAFVRLVLARMPSRWWDDPALAFLVSEAIGSSKLILIPAIGKPVLINEGQGTWDKGFWYSSTFKPTTGYTWKASRPTWRPTLVPGAQAAAARAIVPAATCDDAYRPDAGPDVARWPVLRHGGHALSTLTPMSGRKDRTYHKAVKCTQCGTFGDVYWLDGSPFIDMTHRTPDGTQAGAFDALPWQ